MCTDAETVIDFNYIFTFLIHAPWWYLSTEIFCSSSAISSIDYNGKNWLIEWKRNKKIALDKYYQWSLSHQNITNRSCTCETSIVSTEQHVSRQLLLHNVSITTRASCNTPSIQAESFPRHRPDSYQPSDYIAFLSPAICSIGKVIFSQACFCPRKGVCQVQCPEGKGDGYGRFHV